MANREPENDRWVDDRIALLASAGGLIPNAGIALERLWERNRARTAALKRWILTTAVTAGVGAALVIAPASRACAEQPASCVQRIWRSAAPNDGAVATPIAVLPEMPPSPATVAIVSGRPGTNFKQVGSDTAPVCLEIYLDYECPHCATFVRDMVPGLMEQYIRTGRVRLLYRDFPLPTHRFAKLAARYADAAGQLGYYDAVMKQIFGTRPIWSETGDVDSQVAHVLPPGVMEKLRERVKSDPALDDMISADAAAGHEDDLNQTPFAVIVHEGKRQAITQAPLSLELLRSQIDGLTEQN